MHAVYKGASGQRAIRERRQALGRMRDQESLAEQQEVREMHRVGREEAALMRARAADRDRADLVEQARQEARTAEKQREARRTAAFGRQSLFGSDHARDEAWTGEALVAPAELSIDALSNLVSCDASFASISMISPVSNTHLTLPTKD